MRNPELEELKAFRRDMRELRKEVEAMRDAFILHYPHLDWTAVIEMPEAKKEEAY